MKGTFLFILQVEIFMGVILLIWGAALLFTKKIDKALNKLYLECAIILGGCFLLTAYVLLAGNAAQG